MPRFNFEEEDAHDIATTMIEAMTYYGGIGLAANQIGIETSVFAMETLRFGPIVLFNPMITWLSTDSRLLSEGCLTFPQLELGIRRPSECQVSYQTADGQKMVHHFKGIEARCVQHEMDHLVGVLFTSKVSKLRLRFAQKKQKKRLT